MFMFMLSKFFNYYVLSDNIMICYFFKYEFGIVNFVIFGICVYKSVVNV